MSPDHKEQDMTGLTPKQEAFCLAFIETGNASEAYRRSYDADDMKPATVNRAAKELTDNPKIAARIDGLRTIHVERHKLTIDDLIAQLDEDRQFARTQEAPAAAISATIGKAKLLGFFTDKVEHSGAISVASKEQRDAAVAAASRADQ
jgi:phage terminase small subunit